MNNLDPRRLLPPLNCNGCRRCCINDPIALKPGVDNPKLYKTVKGVGPDAGVTLLKMDKAGNCYALGKRGCQIHDRAPAMCKDFDCRRFVLNHIRTNPQDQGRRWKSEKTAGILRRGIELLKQAGIEIPFGETLPEESAVAVREPVETALRGIEDHG
jgi:hypothetical protein